MFCNRKSVIKLKLKFWAVTQFASPTRRVMIMVSDDGEQAGSRHFGGNVTHPFVTQTYRCVAPYETKDTKNRPFKVAVDEKLDVLIKDPAGEDRTAPTRTPGDV